MGRGSAVQSSVRPKDIKKDKEKNLRVKKTWFLILRFTFTSPEMQTSWVLNLRMTKWFFILYNQFLICWKIWALFLRVSK